jgi:hypothetical protein
MTVLKGSVLRELAVRWKEVRLSIIPAQGDYSKEEREVEAVSRVPASDHADILMRIYESSHSVGEKFRHQVGRPLTLAQVIDVLSHSESPCFSGSWKKESAAFSRYLYRGECPTIPALFCCDYWREAARGLVEGLSPEIQYSRHRSIGHGNPSCLDYVFVSPGVDRKLGLIPTEIRVALEPLRQSLSKRHIGVHWEGFCEDTLYFQADRKSHPLDEEERMLLADELSIETQSRFPQMKLCDVRSSSGY